MTRHIQNWQTVAFIASMIFLSGVVRADSVTDWNEKLVEIMLTEKTNALMQSRNAAIMHVAVFEAVNSLDRRYAPYGKAIDVPKGASADAAATTAAHRSLFALYPKQGNTLDEALARSLSKIPDGAGKRDGIALGQQAAEATLAVRSGDGSDAQGSYAPASNPGAWVPNPSVPPLGPSWGNVKPWVLKNGSQFRPGPPPGLSSDQFKRDYLEVMEIGGKASTRRTTEQTQIASLWMPPGVPMWSPVARQLSIARGLTLAENARLFALLTLSAADAIIACWDTKYAYNNFRPVTAIRGGTGRSDLPADPAWEPAVATPPFPAYVSGHACFGGAALTVLESVFGSGEVATVTIKSANVSGYERKYSRLHTIAAEASNARIWGGIHWRTDQTEGEALGRKVGSHALAQVLRPAQAQ